MSLGKLSLWPTGEPNRIAIVQVFTADSRWRRNCAGFVRKDVSPAVAQSSSTCARRWLAQVWPIYGLLWLIPIGMAMSFLQFFVSDYLNSFITDSTLRATVLSFRGLAYNLAYGGVGLLFAGLIRSLKLHALPGTTEDSIFIAALGWLPWYFLTTALLLVVVVRRKLRPAT